MTQNQKMTELRNPQRGDLIYPDQFMIGDEVEPVLPDGVMPAYRQCTVFKIEPEYNLAHLIRPFVYSHRYPERIRLRGGVEEYAVYLDSKSQKWKLIYRPPVPVEPRILTPCTEPMYRKLASLIAAIKNCEDAELLDKHKNHVKKLVKKHFPSGSDFGNGTELNLTESTPDKLVFTTSFHYYDGGRYDGWTEHRIIVRPDMASGFKIASISGRNRRGIKEYIAGEFHHALNKEVV